MVELYVMVNVLDMMYVMRVCMCLTYHCDLSVYGCCTSISYVTKSSLAPKEGQNPYVASVTLVAFAKTVFDTPCGAPCELLSCCMQSNF